MFVRTQLHTRLNMPMAFPSNIRRLLSIIQLHHIVPRSTAGRSQLQQLREWELVSESYELNTYENGITLCPTCHEYITRGILALGIPEVVIDYLLCHQKAQPTVPLRQVLESFATRANGDMMKGDDDRTPSFTSTLLVEHPPLAFKDVFELFIMKASVLEECDCLHTIHGPEYFQIVDDQFRAVTGDSQTKTDLIAIYDAAVIPRKQESQGKKGKGKAQPDRDNAKVDIIELLGYEGGQRLWRIQQREYGSFLGAFISDERREDMLDKKYAKKIEDLIEGCRDVSAKAVQGKQQRQGRQLRSGHRAGAEGSRTEDAPSARTRSQ